MWKRGRSRKRLSVPFLCCCSWVSKQAVFLLAEALSFSLTMRHGGKVLRSASATATPKGDRGGAGQEGGGGQGGGGAVLAGAMRLRGGQRKPDVKRLDSSRGHDSSGLPTQQKDSSTSSSSSAYPCEVFFPLASHAGSPGIDATVQPSGGDQGGRTRTPTSPSLFPVSSYPDVSQEGPRVVVEDLTHQDKQSLSNTETVLSSSSSPDSSRPSVFSPSSSLSPLSSTSSSFPSSSSSSSGSGMGGTKESFLHSNQAPSYHSRSSTSSTSSSSSSTSPPSVLGRQQKKTPDKEELSETGEENRPNGPSTLGASPPRPPLAPDAAAGAGHRDASSPPQSSTPVCQVVSRTPKTRSATAAASAFNLRSHAKALASCSQTRSACTPTPPGHTPGVGEESTTSSGASPSFLSLASFHRPVISELGQRSAPAVALPDIPASHAAVTESPSNKNNSQKRRGGGRSGGSSRGSRRSMTTPTLKSSPAKGGDGAQPESSSLSSCSPSPAATGAVSSRSHYDTRMRHACPSSVSLPGCSQVPDENDHEDVSAFSSSTKETLTGTSQVKGVAGGGVGGMVTRRGQNKAAAGPEKKKDRSRGGGSTTTTTTTTTTATTSSSRSFLPSGPDPHLIGEVLEAPHLQNSEPFGQQEEGWRGDVQAASDSSPRSRERKGSGGGGTAGGVHSAADSPVSAGTGGRRGVEHQRHGEGRVPSVVSGFLGTAESIEDSCRVEGSVLLVQDRASVTSLEEKRELRSNRSEGHDELHDAGVDTALSGVCPSPSSNTKAVAMIKPESVSRSRLQRGDVEKGEEGMERSWRPSASTVEQSGEDLSEKKNPQGCLPPARRASERVASQKRERRSGQVSLASSPGSSRGPGQARGGGDGRADSSSSLDHKVTQGIQQTASKPKDQKLPSVHTPETNEEDGSVAEPTSSQCGSAPPCPARSVPLSPQEEDSELCANTTCPPKQPRPCASSHVSLNGSSQQVRASALAAARPPQQGVHTPPEDSSRSSLPGSQEDSQSRVQVVGRQGTVVCTPERLELPSRLLQDRRLVAASPSSQSSVGSSGGLGLDTNPNSTATTSRSESCSPQNKFSSLSTSSSFSQPAREDQDQHNTSSSSAQSEMPPTISATFFRRTRRRASQSPSVSTLSVSSQNPFLSPAVPCSSPSPVSSPVLASTSSLASSPLSSSSSSSCASSSASTPHVSSFAFSSSPGTKLPDPLILHAGEGDNNSRGLRRSLRQRQVLTKCQAASVPTTASSSSSSSSLSLPSHPHPPPSSPSGSSVSSLVNAAPVSSSSVSQPSLDNSRSCSPSQHSDCCGSTKLHRTMSGVYAAPLPPPASAGGKGQNKRKMSSISFATAKNAKLAEEGEGQEAKEKKLLSLDDEGKTSCGHDLVIESSSGVPSPMSSAVCSSTAVREFSPAKKTFTKVEGEGDGDESVGGGTKTSLLMEPAGEGQRGTRQGGGVSSRRTGERGGGETGACLSIKRPKAGGGGGRVGCV